MTTNATKTAATKFNAPARCPFLCNFLLGTQKKVDSTRKTILPSRKRDLRSQEITADSALSEVCICEY